MRIKSSIDTCRKDYFYLAVLCTHVWSPGPGIRSILEDSNVALSFYRRESQSRKGLVHGLSFRWWQRWTRNICLLTAHPVAFLPKHTVPEV